jgi:glycosyltransferase involved in cell wall biosynthesis
LRITIVTGFFLPVPALRGGATERSWYGLARNFAAAGHSVTFVSRKLAPLAAEETVDGVRHIRVDGFDHTRHLLANLFLDLLWGIRVGWLVPKADVVICNTLTLPVWLPLFKSSAGRVAVMIGRKPKGQVVLYRGVARIYAPSTFVAKQINAQWALLRTLVIGYPIDWRLLKSSSSQAGSPVTIGFIGRMHPEKGLMLLVGAARLLAKRTDFPPWKIRLIGPSEVNQGGAGPAWAAALRNEAETALGDRFEWMGPQFEPAALARLYGGLDIFCYPSIAEKGETFGVAVAEAMAAGCAVVVSALDCFSDLVTDAESGLVFDHADREPERRLEECLGRLVLDTALRNRLSANGQQKVRRFDYPELSRRVLDDLAVLTGTGTKKQQ